MKYKVWDKVRIVNKRVDRINPSWKMDEYLWTIMTIKILEEDCYKMIEDNWKWYWYDNHIEWLAEEPKLEPEYKVWDIVIWWNNSRKWVIVLVRFSEVIIEIDSSYSYYTWWLRDGTIPEEYESVYSDKYSYIDKSIITKHIPKEELKQVINKEPKFKVWDYVKYKHWQAIYRIDTITAKEIFIKDILKNNIYNTIPNKLEYVKYDNLEWITDNWFDYEFTETFSSIHWEIIDHIDIMNTQSSSIDESILNTYVILNKDRWADKDIKWYTDRWANKIDSFKIRWDKPYVILICNEDWDLMWEQYDTYEEMIEDNIEDWYKLISNWIDKVESKFKIWDTVKTELWQIWHIISFTKSSYDVKFTYEIEWLDWIFTEDYLTKVELRTVTDTWVTWINTYWSIDGTDIWMTWPQVKLAAELSDALTKSFASSLEKTILNTNTKPTMSTLSKIQTEEFFSNKKNVKAIEETMSELDRLEKSFDKVRDDLYTKISRVNSLRNNLSSAVSNDNIKSIQEQLEVLKPRLEFLNRYEENTIKELWFTETKVTSPEDFFKS